MKKNLFNFALIGLVAVGFTACKNNNSTTTGTTTTPSTTPETNTNVAVNTESSPAKEAAQKMCACDGIKNYFAKLKTFDGKSEVEIAKAAIEFASLKKPLDECKKSIKAELQTKYPSYKPADGEYEKEMITACGEIMPQRLIDKYKK